MTNNQILELLPTGDPLGRRILFDPISAITSAIGGVGSIVNGIIGSDAASNAAKIEQTAATNAGNQVVNAAAGVNPTITAAAGNAGNQVQTAAETAGQGVTAAAGTGATAVTGAAQTANTGLNPYSTEGSTAAGQLNTLAQGGFQAPTMAQLQIDPGYAFRLQQGQAALDRSAAARGGAISGGAIKATSDFAQGSASQEYQNAFNRFETTQQNQVQNLQGISNSGQVAATQQGANTLNASIYGSNLGYGAAQYTGNVNTGAAQYAGTANINAADLAGANTIGAAKTAADYLTQGANAAGAGIVGAANATAGAVNGVTNAATGLANRSNASFYQPGTAPNFTPAYPQPVINWGAPPIPPPPPVQYAPPVQ